MRKIKSLRNNIKKIFVFYLFFILVIGIYIQYSSNNNVNAADPDFIPILLWKKTSGVGMSAVAPSVADINNDSKMEIVRSGVNGVEARDSETGNFLWTYSTNMWNDHCPLEIIDLNKDGILEIICSKESGTVALHGDTGDEYWYNPNAPLNNKHSVAGDINGDGYPEVFVCTDGSITALTHDGQIFASTYTYYPCFGGLSLGDTNQDGVFELYLNERSYSYHNNHRGEGVKAYWASNLTKIWTHPEMLSSSHVPTLVDVDKDGKLDVVSLQQSGGGIYVYNSTNGDIIHGGLIPNLKCHSQPTVYDIDEDGNLELIACREFSLPIVWDLYKWQQDAILPYGCFEPPAVADINGDGYVEILASTSDNITIFDHNYNEIGNITVSNPGLYGMAFIIAQDADNDGLNELIFNRGSEIYVYDTITQSPTPRALSQFQFYSQHRGRSPYYVQFDPLAPIIKNETPKNAATNQFFNPTLSVYIDDYQNDFMTITFKTNAKTGIWHEIDSFTGYDGPYSTTSTEMNSFATTYLWSVKATDSTGQSTEKIFKFKTKGIVQISNPIPANDTSDFETNPKLSIQAEEYYGKTMTIKFETNADGSWKTIGTNTSVYNGTYQQIPDNMDDYNKTYYWRVTCSNGAQSVIETYHFKTYNQPEINWWNNDWLYVKEIKIDKTKVISDLKNFPILINLPSDINLAAHTQINGDDIVFIDQNGFKLNHEIELYNKNTGRIVAWINITNLQSSNDTRIFMYYGNNNCSNQQNPQGTWNTDYLMVHHMEETDDIYDSTKNNLDAINSGTNTDNNGKIDSCRYFDNILDNYDFGTSDNLNPSMNSWTISLWTKINYLDGTNILQKWGSNSGFNIILSNGFGGFNYVRISDGTKTALRYWNTQWADNNWHYINIIINRNSDLLEVYLDGNPSNGGGVENITGLNSITSTSNLRMYGGNNGRHDELTISTTVRNSSWIKTSYNNQNNPSSFYNLYPEIKLSEPPEPNLPPTHSNPLLRSEFGSNSDYEDIICINQSTTDPNEDEVYNTYHWIRNGISITNLLLSFNIINNNTVKDYSGYNNNGIITGLTWNENGIIGESYSFAGTDSQDYITIPDDTNLHGGGTWSSITIEHWIYLELDQTNTNTISKMSLQPQTKSSYQIGFENTTNKLYGSILIGNNNHLSVTYNTPLISSKWYHVVLTYKSGIGLKLYVNGIAVATAPGIGNIQASDGKDLYIGCRYGTENFFDGKIDEVKIYQIALSPQQIYNNYLQSKNGYSSISTIVADETNIGDTWQCEITPSDGQQDGQKKISNALTIIKTPDIPSNPKPSNGATSVNINTLLSWNCSDPDGYNLRYDIYFGTNSNPPIASQGQINTTFNPGTLSYSKHYYWKIIAKNENDAISISPIWSFTTKAKTSGGGGTSSVSNKYPIANASKSDTTAIIGSPVNFDGSASIDPDGTIISYNWIFGDGDTGSGKITTHIYSRIGKYTVKLTVTDNSEATASDTIDVIVTGIANNQPTTPLITGQQNGTRNTIYSFTAVSSDKDSDYIKYNFSWGDSSYYISDLYPSGVIVFASHNWSDAGVYKINIKAYDNYSESNISSFIILIDSCWVNNFGYLIDKDSDGTYENFYSNKTNNITETEKKSDGTILINNDDDPNWDGFYEKETNTYIEISASDQPIKKEVSNSTLYFIIFVTSIIALVLIYIFIIKKK